MITDIDQITLNLSPELRIPALRGRFQTQAWLVMYPSRTWTEMKDSHIIRDTELMNCRIITAGRDLRRPLVQCHDQSTSSIVVSSISEIMPGSCQVILSTNKDRDLKPPLSLSSSA